MYTVNILRHLVENYQVWIYFFIFLGLMLEGEFVLLSVGIFLHLGVLNFYFTLFFICLGMLSKTIFGYYFGRFIGERWRNTRFLRYIEKRVLNIMPHFNQKPFWSIFISKFILGVNNLVIVFSGYQKVNFSKYLKAEFFSTIVWAPLLVLLGYFFSHTAINISHEIWRFSLIVLILVILFVIFDKVLRYIYEIFEEFYHDHNKTL